MTGGTCPIVYLVYSKWVHHSPHSGYDQLSKHVGVPLRVPSTLLRVAGVRLLAGTYSGLRGYDSAKFYNDLIAGLSMLWSHEAIYHHLYGDFAHRYLRRFPGSRRHKILATFHLPSQTLKDKGAKTEHVRDLDGVVVVGRNQMNFFSDLVGSERVFFVPHGVDTTTFLPDERTALDHNPTVLCVGQTLRDFSTLYEVAFRVGERVPEARFLLVAHPTGIEADLARLTSLANFEFRTGISEAELIQTYQDSQLLFLPLLDSTANNSLLEGMACGLPVVVTDVGGVRDYVKEDSVALIPPGDSKAAAEAIMGLLQDERNRGQWGEANRKRALRFDWPVVAEEMRGVYQQVWER